MKVLKVALLFFLLPCLATFTFSQGSPSLGDIARRARSEKGTSAPPAQVSDAGVTKSSAATPAPAARVENKNAETEQEKMSRPSAEANLNATNRYKDQVRTLFDTENFDKIDQMADADRTSKTRLAGGFWGHSSPLPSSNDSSSWGL